MPLSLDKIRELRQKRARLAEEARGLLQKAEDEKRDLSAEEDQRFAAIHTESEELRTRIEREERQTDLESQLEEREELRAPGGGQESADGEERQERYRRAYGAWLRHGEAGMDAEDRQALRTGVGRLPDEARALGVAPDTAGGYLVPEEFSNQLEEAMKAFGGMRESGATIMRTSSGARLLMPTTNDTANKGARIGENTEITELDPSYGQKALGAHMYTSRIVRVSLQLLQDTDFNVETHLSAVLGTRIGRSTNEDFTSADGADKPEGALTTSTEGKETASSTAITFEELVDLEHSVDPAYRRNARFMFHDTTLRTLKKLKDSEGRPLWLPGIAVREPDTLLSYRYVINQDMEEIAAAKKTILFGDFAKYHIRDVRAIQLVQFREKYMNFLQVGFMAFSRHDGALLDAGTNPLKHLKMKP